MVHLPPRKSSWSPLDKTEGLDVVSKRKISTPVRNRKQVIQFYLSSSSSSSLEKKTLFYP
jgi:hypothetical protein